MRHSPMQTVRQRIGHRAPRRRAAVTLELLLAVPVLFLTTLAIFQLSLLSLAQETVVTAAVEGSREAARVGSTSGSVQTVVETVLLPYQIIVAPNSGARVDLYDGLTNTNTVLGDLSITPTFLGPVPDNNEVRVTVSVLRTISNNRPVPNWLSSVGFDWNGENVIRYSVIARRE